MKLKRISGLSVKENLRFSIESQPFSAIARELNEVISSFNVLILSLIGAFTVFCGSSNWRIVNQRREVSLENFVCVFLSFMMIRITA